MKLHTGCIIVVGIASLTQLPCRADTAYLRPGRIFEGDIARLVIEYDNRIPSLYEVDTSALEADFEVLGVDSMISRINEPDATFHRTQLTVSLLPRRVGKLHVPALHFGGRSSAPLLLDVRPEPVVQKSAHLVLVEVDAIPLNPYIGQQTRINTRLYHNTELEDGDLVEPKTDSALKYRTNDERSYTVTRNLGQFQVLQRSVVLFPTATGELELAPASYQGGISQNRLIHRRSEALALQVRQPPPDYRGEFWLPAKKLTLSRTWGQHPEQLRVGDSLDFTLSIVATGLAAESLPSGLLSGDSRQMKIYADQEDLSNRFEGENLVGRIDQRYAVVLTSPGQVTLPGISLDWWLVDSDTAQQALLESRTLNVAVAAAPEQARLRDPRALFDKLVTSPGLWILLLVGLIGGVGYFQGPLWGRMMHALGPVLRRRRVLRELRRACLANDPRKAKNALLEWGRERWPGTPMNGLHQIQDKMHLDELARLDAALYARDRRQWDGRELWQSIGELCRPVKTRIEAGGFAGLYPR